MLCFACLAGWLPDREEGLSASQQLEVHRRLSLLSPLLSQVVVGLVVAPEPPSFPLPRRRDNGEDSGTQHREANKPNSRQALCYNTKASAAAALPKAEGKNNKRGGGGKKKSPSESQPFCYSRIIVLLDLRLFFFFFLYVSTLPVETIVKAKQQLALVNISSPAY